MSDTPRPDAPILSYIRVLSHLPVMEQIERLSVARLLEERNALLAACKAALYDPELIYTGADCEPLDTCGFHVELRDMLRAAIAKAEGK